MKNRFVVSIFILSICTFTVSFGGAEARKAANKASYMANVSTLLQAKWPNNRIINIVSHGHSVPAGYFKTPVVDTFNAYPYLLHKNLKSRYPNAIINVIVTGIGSEASDLGARRFKKDILSHNPDVITIDYGLNDRYIGLQKARLSWSSMIEAAQATGVKVILLTPTGDLGSQLDSPGDPLNKHAQQIRDLAEEYEVGLADSLAAFKAYINNGGELADLMSQNVHPNRKGHDLVVEQLLEWFPE